MSSLEVETWIEATPERVFEVITDLEKLPDRIEAIQEVEILTDGPLGIGTRFREKRIMFKREATEEMEFTAFDPPRSFVLTAESHGARYISTHTLEPEREGTRVRLAFKSEALAPLTRFVSAVLMPFFVGATRKALQSDLDSLKKAAESRSD